MDISSIEGNWVRGTVTVNSRLYAFSAKVYPEPSEGFGITDLGGDGHISKLTVTDERNENTVMNYDRGWDFNIIPETAPGIISQIESYYVLDAVEKELSS